jgi:hypothetical protein
MTHFLVLQHTAKVKPYIEEHMEMLRQQNSHQGEAWLARAHMSGFNIWFRDQLASSTSCVDERLRKLVLTVINSYYKPSIKHEKGYKCNHHHRIGTQLTEFHEF